MKLNFTLGSKFEEKGTHGTKGLYPLKNTTSLYLLDENDAYYGFTTVTYTKKQDLQADHINYSFVIGGGVKAKMVDNCYLLVNPSYLVGLNDIMPKKTGNYVNIFGEKKEATPFKLSQFALRIGVSFMI